METQQDKERQHMKEECAEMTAKLEAQRQEAKQDKLELEAKIQRLQDEAKPQRASDAITEENLDALQSRLQELHAAQLLTDDLMDAIMDTIADCIELLLMKKFTDSIVEKVAKVANLSSKMKNDASFARQLRRRFT
jgi:hypothetical protein